MNEIEFENGSLDDLLDGTPSTDTNNEDSTFQDDDIPVDNPDWLDESQDNPDDNGGDNTIEDSDVITSFLKEFGVENGKITYETDNGETEEVDFYSLDRNEQLNILKELTSPNQLTDSEIQTVNYLRSNNVTLQDVVEYFSQMAVQNYIASQNNQRSYKIDDYSDDELYIADLKIRMPDMSEEDMKMDLESAKENPELFEKKVKTIRNNYKQREEAEHNEQVKQRETAQKEFLNNLNTTIRDFAGVPLDYKDKESMVISLNNNEKESIYNYLVRTDEHGETNFSKDLKDPKKWVSFAWFNLYGLDAISDVSRYWKNELKTTRRETQRPRQTQTTIKRTDNKPRQITDHHRNSIEFIGGENLL